MDVGMEFNCLTQVTSKQNPREFNQPMQSAVEIGEQPINIRAWKRILHQPSPNVAMVQPELERKRKLSSSVMDPSDFPHKHMQVPQEDQNSNNSMVEAIG